MLLSLCNHQRGNETLKLKNVKNCGFDLFKITERYFKSIQKDIGLNAKVLYIFNVFALTLME